MRINAVPLAPPVQALELLGEREGSERERDQPFNIDITK